MVEYLLGNYLVCMGKITSQQLETVIAKQDETRVKMGLLAVSEGMMTIKQAEEINRLQTSVDKRFGDIAVERGYLTEDQISNLLKKQGNAYLAFAQALVNEGLMKMQELEQMLDGYQQENGFTKSDMEDLRSDEPERIVPLFLPHNMLCMKELVGVLVRTLIRCVDRHVYLGKAVLSDSFAAKQAVFQKTVNFTLPVAGRRELETGLAEVDGGLFTMSAAFFKHQIELDEEDLTDAAGELLNCVNGLFVSDVSRRGIRSEMRPPTEQHNFVLQEAGILSIPIYVKDKKAFFIIRGKK